MPGFKRITFFSFLVISLVLLALWISINKSEYIRDYLYTLYYPSVDDAAAYLRDDSVQRIERSVLFKEKFSKKVGYAIGSTVAQLDSYINRTSLSKNELRTSIRQIARSAFLRAVKTPAGNLHGDLLAIENFYRSRIDIDPKRSTNCEIEMDIGSLKGTILINNLHGIPSGALKIADTAAEFLPIIGDVWGFTKFVYDPRVEVMVLKPAERYFRPKIHSALTEYRLCLETHYMNKAAIKDRLIADANLYTIISRTELW